MTEENQNVDKHCLTMMSCDEPSTDGVFLRIEIVFQVTWQCKATGELHYLGWAHHCYQYPMSKLPVRCYLHIPHCYRWEMRNKSETVSTRLWFILSQNINFTFHVLLFAVIVFIFYLHCLNATFLLSRIIPLSFSDIPRYGPHKYDPHTKGNIGRIEAVQRRSARFVTTCWQV